MTTHMQDAPITVLLCALGGEGGGVLADWLVDVARRCGHGVQGTSIPGVAQRTGATTYYVEISPRPLAELGGRKPVFGLYAVPGALDLMVGSELLEVARQCVNGMASPERTAVIASTSRALTVVEKMHQGDGRVSDERLLAVLRAAACEAEVLDMGALAAEAGTVISAVMLGAIGAWGQASGRLPFPREAYEATIREGGKGVAASLRGFALAWERVQATRTQREAVLAVADALAATPPTALADVQHLPAPVREIAALGLARVREYQDAAYGALYLQRLGAVVAADSGTHDASQEAARWLALWMAFDDLVRVADLKSRASRFERVAREARAEPDTLLRVYEHFKPGVPEFAGLLPPAWAERLRRWDARRVAAGHERLELPLKLASHSVAGFVALRALASLKGWRRRGERYAQEQAQIERWLAALTQGLAAAPVLGLEIARCGRLVKGYGSTNERGKRNLLHVLEHLAFDAARAPAERAAAIAAAREAALADEAGRRLDQTLVAHGAPARPLVAQPIRFHRRRPA